VAFPLLIVLLAAAVQVTGSAQAGQAWLYPSRREVYVLRYARSDALSQRATSLVTFPRYPAGRRAPPCLTLVAEAAY
jgi:hypothetical protein